MSERAATYLQGIVACRVMIECPHCKQTITVETEAFETQYRGQTILSVPATKAKGYLSVAHDCRIALVDKGESE